LVQLRGARREESRVATPIAVRGCYRSLSRTPDKRRTLTRNLRSANFDPRLRGDRLFLLVSEAQDERQRGVESRHIVCSEAADLPPDAFLPDRYGLRP
jgi:hypothetical protein